MRRKGIVLTAVLMAVALFSIPAFAAGEKSDDAWQFDLAPLYL